MAETAIEWATHTWNPFTGCDRVSPGCAHCYAADVAASMQRRERGRLRLAAEQGKPAPRTRYQNDGRPKTSGPGFGFTVHQDKLDRPPSFPAGARVFVNSMSDVFHEDAPDRAIAQLLVRCAERPRADFLILTKRPERMHELLRSWRFCKLVLSECSRAFDLMQWEEESYFPNVWLGVTIENRRFVHRAELLRQTPAAVRFISAEPLLGPLVYDSDIGMATDGWPVDPEDDHLGVPEHLRGDPYTPAWLDGAGLPELDLHGIDWLIAGGESGTKHRRFDPDWARDLRTACAETGTAFFFKQHGGHTPKTGGRQLDGRTWDEFPRTATEVAHGL